MATADLAVRGKNVQRSNPVPVFDVVEVLDPFALTLDTSIYADGDVLAATQEVTGVMTDAGGKAKLASVVVIDKDDNGTAMDLVFLKTNVALGTENAAPNITDTNAEQILGVVNVATGDFVDLGGVRVATLTEKSHTKLGFLLEAAASSTSVFVAAITRGGTPTYTASGVMLRLGVVRY